MDLLESEIFIKGHIEYFNITLIALFSFVKLYMYLTCFQSGDEDNKFSLYTIK